MTQSITAAWPREGGGPDVIQVGPREMPQPAAGQVLIEVQFGGVNRHDVNQRIRGTAPKGATDILGLEVSGRIIAVGDGVSIHRLGEEVCALVNGGGYATYCIADAALALSRPAALSAQEAAGLPEALFTAWFNIVEQGKITAGQWLLVHGGTSGVGSITIQLAKYLGAHVIATAGSDEKCEASLRFGADVAINYRKQDFVVEALGATQGRGVDLILDMVGGDYAQRNLATLAVEGLILHLASGSVPDWTAPLRLIMEKRARISGSLLRPLELAKKEAIAQRLIEEVWPVLGTRIRPVVDRVFLLQDAAKAHAYMESSRHIGKILLQCA
jgi:NADPH:quinone reductase